MLRRGIGLYRHRRAGQACDRDPPPQRPYAGPEKKPRAEEKQTKQTFSLYFSSLSFETAPWRAGYRASPSIQQSEIPWTDIKTYVKYVTISATNEIMLRCSVNSCVVGLPEI